MKLTVSVRVLSIVLGAALGLLVGCGVKASSNRKPSGNSAVSAQAPTSCNSIPTFYIFPGGISGFDGSNVPTSPSEDHFQSTVCDQGKTITWEVAPTATTTVAAFHVYFDESPCTTAANFGPELLTSAGAPPTISCTVQINAPKNTYAARAHKYELIIDDKDNAGKIYHRYLDPHVVVAGTGQLE